MLMSGIENRLGGAAGALAGRPPKLYHFPAGGSVCAILVGGWNVQRGVVPCSTSVCVERTDGWDMCRRAVLLST